MVWRLRAARVSSAALVTVLVATIITPEWIELVFRVDPDGGDGSLERVVTLVSGLLALASLAWLCVELRRARALPD